MHTHDPWVLVSPGRLVLVVTCWFGLGSINPTLALALAQAQAQGAGQDSPPPRTRSTVERLQPARLKATHEDVLKIQAARRVIPPRAGWNDYRAILHAHAEDSAHTGGTRAEMLAEARNSGVQVIILSDHYRPPRDFVTESWRGLREGVLFLPGSETRGFLIAPSRSVMGQMDRPVPEFIETVKSDGGLIFLSHVEERPDHPMDGLDGLEISNRHYDAKVDKAGLFTLMLKLTDPSALKELEESLKLYPDEIFAFEVDYPKVYLAKWDRETPRRRLTGIAANDCHHNQVLMVKMVDESTVLVGTNVDRDDQMTSVKALLRPGIRQMTRNRKPGDILARVDLDPYHRSFRNLSTHLLAPSLEEASIRDALRTGRAYVAHDWMCDPTGFRLELVVGNSPSGSLTLSMGDEALYSPKFSGRLVAEFPVACQIRWIRDGVVVARASGERGELTVSEPGVYRVEGWLILDGEERPWIYSNPIYLRAPRGETPSDDPKP